MGTTTTTGEVWAVYSRFQGQPTRVHYSHLSQQQAEGEADRMNRHASYYGRMACAWAEPHHPACVFVIG